MMLTYGAMPACKYASDASKDYQACSSARVYPIDWTDRFLCVSIETWYRLAACSRSCIRMFACRLIAWQCMDRGVGGTSIRAFVSPPRMYACTPGHHAMQHTTVSSLPAHTPAMSG